MSTVIALGGNALTRPGQRGTIAEQLASIRKACAALAPLLSDSRVVVTHGNGPQVGNELLRQERAADVAPPLPLYVAVAQTQAEIGTLLALELRSVADRGVTCVLTHVVVAEDDPAFAAPTKPIGPFYSEEEARRFERERGWELVADAGRGWRRVVPSPEPREIVELTSIRELLTAGDVVVACGGGGIPVVRRGGRLKGIDAVIDKDRTSGSLAAGLGADRLVVLTDVPALYRDYGRPSQQEVRDLRPAEAERLLPELASGSMQPKVEAALAVARAGGEALITSAESLGDALEGNAGTRVRAS